MTEQSNPGRHVDEAYVPEYEDAPVYEPDPWKDFPDFSDFAGLDDVIEELTQAELFARNAKLCKEWDVTPAKGILIVGPGGVGKTGLVQALAKHTESELTVVAASDIVTPWVGASNTNLHDVFEKAADDETKRILFFDEFDGMFGPDATGNSGVSNGLIDTMKQCMNYVPENILVIGATNKNTGFDPALLRPGRFDKIIQIPAPNDDARGRIFGTLIGKLMDKYDLDSIKFGELSDRTDSFTGADIKEILQAARARRVIGHLNHGAELTPITHQDILASIATFRRSRPHTNTD